ncbi:MAG: TRAP transporter substrate-binding protein [Azospirillaceae bacterium]
MKFRHLMASTILAAGLAATGTTGVQAQSIEMAMASTYPGSLTQLGTLGIRIADQVGLVSGGDIELTFYEPGELMPALEVFDAVSTGAVDAGWSTPGYWIGIEPALALFGAVPFGPESGEYLAWYYFGGGQELFEEIYHRYNIHSVICGIIAPEASGWFREPIESVEDLNGLVMRFFGLGARVMERMGVSTQLLAGGDIFPALELGTIDATEFSMPAIDLNLGFYQVASHYYFPGWHQQSTLFDLMINLDLWESMNETQQAQIESVCGDSIRYGLAEGEAIQFAALQTLQEDHGVTIHQWPQEILDALEAAWQEEVAALTESDEDFAMVWESLATFREDYAIWREIGYLD